MLGRLRFSICISAIRGIWRPMGPTPVRDGCYYSRLRFSELAFYRRGAWRTTGTVMVVASLHEPASDAPYPCLVRPFSGSSMARSLRQVPASTPICVSGLSSFSDTAAEGISWRAEEAVQRRGALYRFDSRVPPCQACAFIDHYLPARPVDQAAPGDAKA